MSMSKLNRAKRRSIKGRYGDKKAAILAMVKEDSAVTVGQIAKKLAAHSTYVRKVLTAAGITAAVATAPADKVTAVIDTANAGVRPAGCTAKQALILAVHKRNPLLSNGQIAEEAKSNASYVLKVLHDAGTKAGSPATVDLGHKRSQILELHAQHPKMFASDIGERLGCSPSYAAKVLRLLRRGTLPAPVTVAAAPAPEASYAGAVARRAVSVAAEAARIVAKTPVQISVAIPEAGIELKLTRDGHVAGTVVLTSTSVKFTPPSGRYKSGAKPVTWRTVQALQEADL